MIIKGTACTGAKRLADYLLRQGTNEAIHIREIGNYPSAKLTTSCLRHALQLMATEAKAKGLKCALYHVIVALPENETLSDDQLKVTITTLGKNLGLSKKLRVVVEHNKDGRQHFHIVFNIISLKRRTTALWLVQMNKRQRTIARDLEEKLGLRPIAAFGLKNAPAKGQVLRYWEYQRGKRTGIDPLKMRDEVTDAYKQSLTSAEFIRTLAKSDYIITKGKYNCCVLIDKAGDVHGLVRRIHKVKLQDIKRKYPELDTIYLPPLDVIQKRLRTCFAKLLLSTKTTEETNQKTMHRKVTFMMQSDRRPRNAYKTLKYPHNLAELERAEHLAWAIDNSRDDVLAAYGLYPTSGPFDA